MRSLFIDKLEKRRTEHLLRSLKSQSDLVDFAGNDYLGFGRESLQLPELPSGSGASRLISGNFEALEALEADLALRYKADSATLFNSGFEANSGLFSMLTEAGVRVIYDSNIHASIRNALRNAPKPAWGFRHNDLEDLERKLQKSNTATAVVTEGLFSMDGDLAPLKEIAALKSRYGFTLIIDEAHSSGIIGGLTGLSGTCDCLDSVDIRIHTFGKAMGAQGAIIAGEPYLRDALVNFCRPLIYSTSPSPVMIALIALAHERFEATASARQGALKKNIAYYHTLAAGTDGLSLNHGPIQTYHVGTTLGVMNLANHIEGKGFQVGAIRQPTVEAGTERLRISLTAMHKEQEIKELVTIIGNNLLS